MDEVGSTAMISAIGGIGGIGKTWLALTWAYRNLHRFPDGQLFVDLHGYSPNAGPIAPEDAVRRLLAGLGVAPNRIPADPDVQAALYRSLVAGRRMLIVLDNAATSEQVVPLMPGSPTCTVLVTSRTVLPSLLDRYGTRHLPLDVLTDDDARDVLARRLGDGRVADEPHATEVLIELCGRHPLALTIIARHAAIRPSIPLAEFAGELRTLGMDMLDHDSDPAASLPTVLSWSLRALTQQQRAIFGLLGIVPSRNFDVPTAAFCVGLPHAQTRRALHTLTEHALIDRNPGGRYAMHDLVRAYAATTARKLPVDTVVDALHRLVEWETRFNELYPEVGPADLRKYGLESLNRTESSMALVVYWTIRHLTVHQRRVFSLLAITLFFVNDIDLASLTPLADLPEELVDSALRDLTRMSLVEDHPNDRYELHELIHALVAAPAYHELSTTDRDRAVRWAADRLLHRRQM